MQPHMVFQTYSVHSLWRNSEKQAYFETSEKASTHTAGQGTMRMAMRPRAAG